MQKPGPQVLTSVMFAIGLATGCSRGRTDALFCPTLGEPGRPGGVATKPVPSPAPTLVGAYMKLMNGSLLRLRTIPADAANRDECLRVVTEFQAATVQAKAMVPQSIAALPDPERATTLAAYRAAMTHLLQAEVDLESALLAGQFDRASESIDEIAEIMKHGHDEFRSAD